MFSMCKSPYCTYTAQHTDYNHCPDCGEAMVNKCPSCESEILSAKHRHCTNCGEKYKFDMEPITESVF